MHSRPKTQQRKVTALADGAGANVGEEQRTECAYVEVMVLWFIGEKAPIRVGGCLRNLPCAAARILPMPFENLPPVNSRWSFAHMQRSRSLGFRKLNAVRLGQTGNFWIKCLMDR
jgi:hypothetical protein